MEEFKSPIQEIFKKPNESKDWLVMLYTGSEMSPKEFCEEFITLAKIRLEPVDRPVFYHQLRAAMDKCMADLYLKNTRGYRGVDYTMRKHADEFVEMMAHLEYLR